MLNNGITFVRVITHGIANSFDLRQELSSSKDYRTMRRTILRDWKRNPVDVDDRQWGSELALSVLQAEFSMIEPEITEALTNEQDPEETAFNLGVGIDVPEFVPNIVFSDEGKNRRFLVHSRILSSRELSHACEFAKRRGYYSSIPSLELSNAQAGVLKAQDDLKAGIVNYADFPARSTLALTGQQLQAGIEREREDVTLNIIFNRRPETYRRVSDMLRRAELA